MDDTNAAQDGNRGEPAGGSRWDTSGTYAARDGGPAESTRGHTTAANNAISNASWGDPAFLDNPRPYDRTNAFDYTKQNEDDVMSGEDDADDA